MNQLSEALAIAHETLSSLTQDMDPEDRVSFYNVLISSCQSRRANALEEIDE